MLALDREEEMQDAVAAMVEACDQVASGEIAVATRSVTLNGVNVKEGQIIGVVDGQLCVADSDIEVVLQRVLDEMEMGDRELVSLYYGLDVSEEEAREVVEKIESLYPEVEIELLSGGQPIYKYILGAE
jgi:hypothetical protein